MEKVLLVTGGSRGIGAATCTLAAQQAGAVTINYTTMSLIDISGGR
jgi:NAD(P)-dependent dehydrogenase (short-subunit alcohol dehydrogenase family)